MSDMAVKEVSPYYGDDIDLREVFKTLWNSRWWVMGITIATTVFAVVASLNMPNVYRSEVVLAPAAVENRSAMASLPGQLGGLAGLVGIDLGSAAVDDTTLALETLKSRVFLVEFINRHDLLVPLMAAKAWSMEADDWVIDSDLYDVQGQKWIGKTKASQNSRPTDWEAYKVLRGLISVSEDKKTGIIRVGIESFSPRLAKKWVSQLIVDLNKYLRESDVAEARRSISFLEEQLQRTSVDEIQNILYQLIEQQTKVIMLSEVRDGYVFRVIDPAIIPEEKSRPMRSQIVIFSGIGGAIFSTVFILLMNAFRWKDTEKIQ